MAIKDGKNVNKKVYFLQGGLSAFFMRILLRRLHLSLNESGLLRQEEIDRIARNLDSLRAIKLQV